MHSKRSFQGSVLLMTLLICVAGAFAYETDDYVPEVTDRVARISFIRGDVQIRRTDSQDWEKAILNLPVVEGDEIVTDGLSRLEIQFDISKHLRIAENSQVKIVGLKDEGIAISVPLGSVTIRAVEFDPSKSYFEIDAPRTTVSIQKPGSYRVDSGTADSIEIFISAIDGGEARVYSTDAGFSVKNNRRARIFIGGNQSGEWETADASLSLDEFWGWSAERDAVIAARLKGAYYDQYYDRDIYGADDLNAYGDWVYTSSYGYIWRPYKASINGYADWTPYRYGHWRWISSYGWTWVNDEPWGWATYHHGRWVWHNSGWYWSPYGYYRTRRSWWHPAIVVVRVIASSVYWYPLPYNYAYYDYNCGYYSRRRHRNGNYNNNSPTPAPGSAPTAATIRQPLNTRIPLESVPTTGVVTVPTSEFGRGKGRFGNISTGVAQEVLSKAPIDPVESPPILPTYVDLNGKVSQEIRSSRPPVLRANPDVQVGAATRTPDAPLDQQLMRSRIRGNREPLQSSPTQANPGEVRDTDGGVLSGPRRTGAVERQVKPNGGITPPIIETPTVETPPIIQETPPVRNMPPKQETPVEDAPPRVEPVRVPRQPRRDDGVISEPVRIPRRDPAPRNDPPPTRNDTPPTRHDPPPKQDSPPPKNDPPPRKDPPPKNDPPPPKSEPKPDTLVDRRKDGRLR